MRVKCNNDALFIAQRLKQINSNYYVVFNARNQKWEVHFKGQKPNSLCVTVPYDALDERTVTLVNKTKTENQKALIAEIEHANLLAEQRALREQQREIEANLQQAFCAQKE